MVGTLNSGPGFTRRDTQSQNAQMPRGTRSDRGSANANNGQGGQHYVHGEPAAGAGFTFERATKIQCVKGVTYSVAPDSAEAAYFITHSSSALQAAASLPAPAVTSELLREVGSALEAAGEVNAVNVITIRQMEHTQLKFVADPPISQREPPGNDAAYTPLEWENYQIVGADDKLMFYVQSPASEGGKHYEVLNQRSWDFNVRIVGELNLGVRFVKDKNGAPAALGDIDYAFMLRLGRRGQHHVYQQSMKANEVVLCVSVGEINASTGNFVAWSGGGANTDLVCVKDGALQNALFSQMNLRGHHWPVWQPPDAIEDVDDVMADLRASLAGGGGCRQRFNLIERSGVMNIMCETKGGKEQELISVCNFELVSLRGLYQFVEADCGDPYFSILCRSMIDEEGSGEIYIAADDTIRTPRLKGKRSLLVEVLVQPGALKSNADVSRLFQKHHINLLPSSMTPDMLRCWLAEQDLPPVTRCIVRFGRQPDDEWVLGNVVFKRDVLVELETAKIAVVPQFFKDSILPIPMQATPG